MNNIVVLIVRRAKQHLLAVAKFKKKKGEKGALHLSLFLQNVYN